VVIIYCENKIEIYNDKIFIQFRMRKSNKYSNAIYCLIICTSIVGIIGFIISIKYYLYVGDVYNQYIDKPNADGIYTYICNGSCKCIEKSCDCTETSTITELPTLRIKAITQYRAHLYAINEYKWKCDCNIENIECEHIITKIKCSGECNDVGVRLKMCRTVRLEYEYIPDEQYIESISMENYDHLFENNLLRFCIENNCNDIFYVYEDDKKRRCYYM